MDKMLIISSSEELKIAVFCLVSFRFNLYIRGLLQAMTFLFDCFH